ncbi:MAG TPA: mechanosensitive ion channel domain-containing protein [Acidisoma sp.]|uniref:mechanosensitive ion channel family protein n=1 Tax=Acidisoma sp. TaxID=1872115 RepID=UPI002C71E738|nr:mechanosensitive ion channel domain-containing protein [Acidisoma sp.]HTI01502.1 mechanosensitive ion channel domain-containing protein [Acidisoma sp.]
MRHADRAAMGGVRRLRWLGQALALLLVLIPGLILCESAAQAAESAPVAAAAPIMRDDPLEPLDTSSPSATYQSFLQQTARVQALFVTYLRHKTIAGEKELVLTARRTGRLFDLSNIAPALRDKMGASATMYLADILHRLPEISPSAIPGAPGWSLGTAGTKLPDQWRVPGTEITIARVEKGPQKGQYLFTADSVDQLAADHALILKLPLLRPTLFGNWRQVQVNITGPLVPDGFVKRLPNWALGTVLGTPVWKMGATLLILAVVLCLMIGWALVVRRMGAGHGRFRHAAVALAAPLGFFVLYVSCVIIVRSQLNLSGGFSAIEAFFSVLVLYLIAAWGAWTLCFLLAEAIIAAPSIPDNSYDSHLLRLCARLAGFAAVAGLLLYGANQIGIPALGLVAGLGVGGIAVALASQSTVENLIGGFSIFADRPFRVGDFIQHSEKSGWVEAIGPRSSRIRELDGALTTVPNGDLARMHITNFSMRTKCLFVHEIGLRYETSTEQCEWLIGALRGFLADHPLVEKAPGFPRVALTGFGDSAITVQLQANILTTDYAAFLAVQETLLLGIMRLVSEAGTGFAFPSQTAYLARDGGIDRTIQARIAAEMAARTAPAPSQPG